MGQSREDSMGKNTLLCCLLLWGAAIGQEEVTDEVPPEEDVVVSDNEVTEEVDDGHVAVHTFLGVAKGLRAETESGTPYFTFKGIPYAHPPVGSLRFQPPQPSSSWGDTLVATEYGSVCPQQEVFGENTGSYKGEEDCLYLNIYTPTLTRSSNPFALKAVMLWIHGGGSVHAQVLSHLNQGLIHGAIAQSGNILYTPIEDRPEKMAMKVGEKFNCSSNDLDEAMLDCLQEIPAQELIEGTALDPSDWFGVDNLVFSPVVDHFCSNPFMPIHPLEAVKSGAYNKIPYMSGTSKEDGALFTMMFWDSLETIQEKWDTIGAGILNIMKTRNDIDEETQMIAEITKKYYTGDDFTQENKDSLTAMFGDAIFLAGDQKTVSLMSEGSPPVYNYLLTYKGSNTFTKFFTESEEDFGVVHGDDLLYLFKSPIYDEGVEFTQDDTKMIDLMVTYWSNFAKYGNPTPFKDAGIADWTPVQPNQKNYLDI